MNRQQVIKLKDEYQNKALVELSLRDKCEKNDKASRLRHMINAHYYFEVGVFIDLFSRKPDKREKLDLRKRARKIVQNAGAGAGGVNCEKFVWDVRSVMGDTDT